MANKTKTVAIDGEHLTLERAEAIARGAKVVMSPFTRGRIEASRKLVRKAAQGSEAIYGVNTGYGYLANTPISRGRLRTLQLNLLKSHASGYGTPLSTAEARLAMALRLNVLVKGYTGVRYELCEALCRLVCKDIIPLIPEHGSVGASGDLIPLAHLALPLVGLGRVRYKGKEMSAAAALKKAKLKPITLMEKEGIGLVNGTQVMLAVGGLALSRALALADKAEKITALTFEAMQGDVDALDPLLHKLRGQEGQKESAQLLREQLEGSYLWDKGLTHLRVQDPYSLRCAAQVHGPTRDALHYALTIVERELNAATDNPLVFVDQERIVHGGNFHGQALAMAFDIAAIAVSELANISERRLELLLNPHHSKLPAFLTPHKGVNSGYMATQYLSASLVNDNKVLATPACTDSIPSNVGVEDHVSMGMTSARKFKKIVENTHTVLAVEMLAAAQGVDLRNAKPLGQGTKKTYQALRGTVPRLSKDRIIADDIKEAVAVLEAL